MADKLILIDLNIVLDVLQKRAPYYEASANLLAAVETGRVNGYLAAHSLTTLFYLIKKDLLQFIKVAPVDQTTIEQALNLNYPDFEDAVQMMSAVQCKVNCLVTRNIKDYQPALLPVMQPVEYLATL
jgi:hypothetical protein